jgi:hypothetical protein
MHEPHETDATLLSMVRDPVTGEEFIQVVGKRAQRPLDEPPSTRARELLGAMAQYRTRTPKGIFIYRSHAEMDADRLRWTVEAMVERARNA